jgi:hypothetical protein
VDVVTSNTRQAVNWFQQTFHVGRTPGHGYTQGNMTPGIWDPRVQKCTLVLPRRGSCDGIGSLDAEGKERHVARIPADAVAERLVRDCDDSVCCEELIIKDDGGACITHCTCEDCVNIKQDFRGTDSEGENFIRFLRDAD